MAKLDDMWTGTSDRDDVVVPLAEEENAMHPVPENHYFEHWYFDAKLDDGHVVVGFIQTSELVRRKPGVELHVYKPDGEKLSIVKSYPESQVSSSDKKSDTTIGKNRCYSEFPKEGLPVHHLFLAEEDMEFDLTFHNLMPGWKPGSGEARYNGEEFFCWAVPAPRASVEGKVRYGNTELNASGIGYHDHNWGNGDMKRIVDHWYWGRLYTDRITLLYAQVITQKGYNKTTKPLMLAIDNNVVLSSGEMTLTEGPPVFNKTANRTYPSYIQMAIPDQLKLKLEVHDVIDAHDFVADIPVLGSRLVKPLANRLVGRPGYFRFNSGFELSASVNGESIEKTGTTLHEMVALR